MNLRLISVSALLVLAASGALLISSHMKGEKATATVQAEPDIVVPDAETSEAENAEETRLSVTEMQSIVDALNQQYGLSIICPPVQEALDAEQQGMPYSSPILDELQAMLAKEFHDYMEAQMKDYQAFREEHGIRDATEEELRAFGVTTE